MLLVVLAIVLVGSVLAATTSSLALLIVARVLQAASFALYPISIAILREELPRTGWVRRWRCCRARWVSAAAPDSWWSAC